MADDDPLALLARAVNVGDVDAARRTLAQHPALGARLNDAVPGDAFGGTILRPAVEHQNRAMIDLLLAHGADINQRSHWWAGSFGVLDACDPTFAPWLIERGARVDAHAAARLGMLDRLDQLVSADASLVHARGGDGQTPLHFAANVEIARYLVDHGADVNARDVDHESTPAQWMIRDRQEVARFLIDRGAATDILMAAALDGIQLVRRHLDDDPACIRTSVSSRWFPMTNPEAGGTIYIWTLGSGKTAHLVAREFDHEDILMLLFERSPEPFQLAMRCELGDEAGARALVARHPALAQELTDDDRRRIVDAAWNDNFPAVRLMLELGWPVDARNEGGATALHHAAFMGNVAMVRELLRYHADVSAKDDTFGGAAAGWARYGSEHGERAKTGDFAGVLAVLDQS